VSSNWIRWGRLAAMLGGATFMVDGLLELAFSGSGPVHLGVETSGVQSVALLLLLSGMVGFHALQRGSYGLVGRMGFFMLVAGFSVDVLGKAGILPASAAFERLLIIGVLAIMLGFVLYGAATLRAGILPRWCGVGFIVGPALPIVIDPGGGALLGLLWVALGYALWSRRGEPSERPVPVS
jgi:hypothetical protein